MSTAETREVISSYDLTLDWQAYTPQNGLNFFVNEKNVNKIHNRYSASENNTPVEYKELEWKNGVSTTVIGLDKSNTNVKQGDNQMCIRDSTETNDIINDIISINSNFCRSTFHNGI